MKKGIILGTTLLSAISFANYNMVISTKESNYQIRPDSIFNDTGNEKCASFSPLEGDIYKDTSFSQTGTGCEKEQIDQFGYTQWIAIADIVENKQGTLVLDNCKSILNGSHSRGDGIYAINQGGTEFNAYCNMTLDGGGWTLTAVMADDANEYWTWTNRNKFRDGSVYGSVNALTNDYQGEAWNFVTGDQVLLAPGNESKYLRYDTVLSNQTLKSIYPSENTTSSTHSVSKINGSWWKSSCDSGDYSMRTKTPDSDGNGWDQGSLGFIWKSTNNNGCSWDDSYGGLANSASSLVSIEQGWNISKFYHQNFNSVGLFIFVR